MEAKEPCIECPRKVVDTYGYFCDLACGKRTAWLNYRAGVKEVIDWLQKTYIIPLTKQAGLIQVRDLEADLKIKFEECGIK